MLGHIASKSPLELIFAVPAAVVAVAAELFLLLLLMLLLFLLLVLLLMLLLMLLMFLYILISSIFHVAVGEIQKQAFCYLNLRRGRFVLGGSHNAMCAFAAVAMEKIRWSSSRANQGSSFRCFPEGKHGMSNAQSHTGTLTPATEHSFAFVTVGKVE